MQKLDSELLKKQSILCNHMVYLNYEMYFVMVVQTNIGKLQHNIVTLQYILSLACHIEQQTQR